MGNIFFISDTHFYHQNIIEYCNRPFFNTNEMNQVIIDNWNQTVGQDDIVYFLGDFALGSNVEEKYELLKDLLNGTIYFLRGNHDRSRASVGKYFHLIDDLSQIEYNGYHFILSHQPLFNNQIPKNFINIHGHIHDKSLDRNKYDLSCHFNVSVDVIDFTPISIDEIVNVIENNELTPRKEGLDVLKGGDIMRKLATVQKILDIQPIPEADSIEVATIKGWEVVVRKNEFHVGETVVYFEIDSLIPKTSVTEFLMENETAGSARLRTRKMRGQISQGLVLSLGNAYTMNKELNGEDARPFGESEGTDLSDILHIEKYEPPVKYGNEGRSIYWPFSLPKTDEERIQNIPEVLDKIIEDDIHLCVSVKLDGTSMTVINQPDGVHVAGRNNDFDKTDEIAFNNKYWQTALGYELPMVLERAHEATGKLYAVQGELVGPGIQKNRMNLDSLHYYIFNLFESEDDGGSWNKLGYDELIQFCDHFRLDHVPYVYTDFSLKLNEIMTVEDILKFAEGTYRDDAEGYFPNAKEKQQREGLVFRTLNHKYSFKVVNNLYLLNGGD